MDKSNKVYEIFENISSGYDDANNRISLGLQRKWKKTLIEDINSKLGINAKILDLCCGTGDIGIDLSKSKDRKVIGLDFSESMLDFAKNKSKNYTNIDFVRADALNLPFKDEEFDLCVISFGLRNTKDFIKVIKEMKRVIKNEGYIYIMDSFTVENKVIKPFYTLFFKYIMPFLGGGLKKYRQYFWLYESTKKFVNSSELVKMLSDLDLKNIKIRKMLFGACTIVSAQKL